MWRFPHLLVLILCGAHVVYPLAQNLRDHILKIHNDYRAGVPNACQMNRLEYDLALEEQAQKWADGCVFAHESIKGRGENLAWNSADTDEALLMTNASRNWYDEVKMYSLGQYSCDSSCHYTQMVWDTTNKMGCATQRCRPLINGYSDAWYLVCFYLPGGNTNGVRPYQTNCDTPCRNGQTEDDQGLCVGDEITTTSTTTTTTPPPCVDKNGQCETWAKRGECTRNYSYMKGSCAKACLLCGDETGNSNTGGDSGNGDDNDETELCEDDNTQCPVWAGSNQCNSNPGYMLLNCRKSCQVCASEETGTEDNGDEEGKEEEGNEEEDETETEETGSEGNGGEEGKEEEGNEEEEETEPCEDDNSQCPEWAERDQCHSNPGYMLLNCRKSCQVCVSDETDTDNNGEEEEEEEVVETKEPCEDSNTQCPAWAEGQQCERNPGYMLKNCRKSCKQCETEDEDQTEDKEEEEEEEEEEKEEEEEEPCEDSNTQCTDWYERGECEANPFYMLEHCKKACKVCGPCEDQTAKCENWAASGECESNPGFMLKSCRKSCQVCVTETNGPEETTKPVTESETTTYQTAESATPIIESETTTEQISQTTTTIDFTTEEMTQEPEESTTEQNEEEKEKPCEKDKDETMEEEQTTESTTTQSPPCPEDNAKCGYWKRKGLCETNRKFMQRQCQQTCGFCTS